LRWVMSLLLPRQKKCRSARCDTPSSQRMTRYVVIGGGIAGVCCAQEVARLNAADETIDVLLISATELLKEVI
jgi:heterodisulfide reductase subunit A-like polyferredoxin